MYKLYIGGVLFPVTPGKISIKINDKDQTLSLIKEGEVNLLKSPGLSDVSIPELLLPVQRYPFSQPGTRAEPAYYMEKLKAWKKRKKVVKFKLLRYEQTTSELLWDNKMYVTVKDYEILEDADKYGRDVCIKLNLKEYHFWGAKELKIKRGKSSSSKKTSEVKKSARRETKEIQRTYTVKKYDTLLKIARKELDNEALWKNIYELNKKVIEDTARKHGRKSSSNGWWIYEGTVLKLPGGSA